MLVLIFVYLGLKAAYSCNPEEFQCTDNTCITQNFRCDNFEDCKDGSDEIGCLTTGCKEHEFRCGDGRCITNEFRCDKFQDCKDGSDEIGCKVIEKHNCSEGCKEPTLLYEDLQCRPTHISRENCCPVAFDCSHIETRANLAKEKCYFHGKTYGVGDTITRSEIYGTCLSNCTCSKTSGRLGFDCKVITCPEWFSHKLKPDCHFKYELGKCCSSGQECNKGTLISETCKIGDKIYLDGQRYDSPTEKCKYCICKSNSLGHSQMSHCTKFQCVQEIRYLKQVINFCAPSYLTMNDCCPINWICPQNDEIIISKMHKQSKLKCRFGNLKLNIGDQFKRFSKPHRGKVVCECRIPPYLTCIQDSMYHTVV